MFHFLKSDEDFDSTNFIVFLYLWRKPLLLISFAAFLAAIIFTSPYFITPKFKSTVIMYPVASNSISKAILGDNISDKQDVMQFGEEEQTEQMLQLLNSNKIKDRIIEEFGLLEHYKIDKRSMYQRTRLYKAFDNNITFRRTEYMAVKITVLDKDPVMAADIANTIANLLDSTKNVMQKQRAIKAYEIVQTEYSEQLNHVMAMEDSLTKLRQLGVHDYESQAEMIHQQLAMELARNNRQGISALQEQLDILAKFGGAYVSIRDQLEYEKKLLSEKKSRLIFAKVDATEILPQKFVVDEAFPAEKKSYPVRWIIVVISTLSAFVLGMLILAMLDSLTRFKKKKSGQEIDLSVLEIDLLFSRIRNKLFKQEKREIKIFEKGKTVNQKVEKGAEVSDSYRFSKLKITIDMDSQFYQINLLQLLRKWKTHLIIISLAAIILSAIFSGPAFITPKFKSYAVVYPANIASYSDENESEQMLQIMQSKDISDSIIEKFNLPEHYGIDRNYKYFYSTLMWEYSKNVKVNKTPYEGVSIEVKDRDPEIASNIVEAMLYFYNQKVKSLHEIKFGEVVRMYERAILKKEIYIDSLKNRLGELGIQYGLLDYEAQSEQVTKGYLRTIDGSGSSYVRDSKLEELKANIEKKGGEVILLQNLINYEAEKFADLKYNYEKAVMDYDRQFTYVNEITKPYPADKKSYPVRWLVVAISTLAAFFLALIVILILENYRNMTARKQ